MASIKIKLKRIQKSNGLYPVVLQIIKDRKRKIITLGLECSLELWDDKSGCYKARHKNARNNNQLLDTLKIRARNIISDFEMDDLSFDLKELETKFRVGSSKRTELFPLWQTIICELKSAGRMGNARANSDTLRSVKKYAGNDFLTIEGVNVTFLEKYEVFLRSTGGTDGGIGVKMRALRAIYNTAIRRGLVKDKLYPFKDYKISKLKGRSHKQALTIDEIAIFKSADCQEDIKLINAKNYFLFSFYSRGMNFADLMRLEWSNIGEDRISYIRSKTKGLFSIKITEPVRGILNYYKSRSIGTKYVFPILLHNELSSQQIENRKHKILSEYNSSLKILAKDVGILKNLTSYVARHSYAMCLREKGIGIDLIGESLGHQDIKTTKAYVKDFGVDVLDEAVDLLC